MAIVAVLAMVLAACGGDEATTTTAGDDGGDETTTTTQPAEPIVVGFAYPETGIAAAPGRDERDGWTLALDQVGNEVAGRAIETIFVDAAGNPDTGLTATRRLIENENVDFYVFPIFANVGLAVRPVVAESGVPSIIPASCAIVPTLFTPAEESNIVNVGWTCDQPSLIAGDWAREQGYENATVIGTDYAFGWQTVGAFMENFQSAGGSILEQMWTPIQTPDFAPFLSSIPDDTDALFTLMAGANGPAFLKAYRQAGLKDELPLMGIGTMTDFLGDLPAEESEGVITMLHYADGIDTEANREFVAAYKEATGRIPSYEAEAGYSAALMFLQAMETVNGEVEDKDGVMEALRTMSIDVPRGHVEINPETLTPIQNVYVREVQMVDGELRNVPIATFEDVQPWGNRDKDAWLADFQAWATGRP